MFADIFYSAGNPSCSAEKNTRSTLAFESACSGLTFFVDRFSLVREALEKDNISFNSSMGAAKHHWPIAMVLLSKLRTTERKPPMNFKVRHLRLGLEIRIQDMEL